jgi:hypothetical protein
MNFSGAMQKNVGFQLGMTGANYRYVRFRVRWLVARSSTSLISSGWEISSWRRQDVRYTLSWKMLKRWTVVRLDHNHPMAESQRVVQQMRCHKCKDKEVLEYVDHLHESAPRHCVTTLLSDMYWGGGSTTCRWPNLTWKTCMFFTTFNNSSFAHSIWFQHV